MFMSVRSCGRYQTDGTKALKVLDFHLVSEVWYASASESIHVCVFHHDWHMNS